MKFPAAAISLAISSLIFAVASAQLHFRLRETTTSSYLTKEEHWMNQTIDHFSPYDRREFLQRYYEYLDEFRSPDGPIFLKICGESVCSGISNDYIGVLAKKFGAAVVSLEHRYYGKSYPFGSFSTENLRYLSSKQALFDLALFRQYYQESLNAKLNKSTDNPWFVFGISYAGAMSAWFRLKFPHLTCGSLASSGVVLAVYNFTKFDEQVGESAGPECKAVLQEITSLVEQRLESNQKELKKLFNAPMVEKHVYPFLLIGLIPIKRRRLLVFSGRCSSDSGTFSYSYQMMATYSKKAGEDLVEAYAKYVKEYYIDYIGVDVDTYDQQQLKKDKISSSSSSARLWWFQVCTEVAYFQVAPANDSIRSSKLDTRQVYIYYVPTAKRLPFLLIYHLDLCKKVFGDDLPGPDVNATNLYYGGKDIAVPAYIIKCHNCGHGSDMRGCPQSRLVPKGDAKNCSSPDAVNKVRQNIITYIDQWLSECQFSGVSAM
ncbi:hypothetical protein SASPL_143588 [Salvia splendens]|uniref:Serine protease EDA2 n=1 Tax=Salvia splendens TaxID=180675 RepID=A0A8X8ZA58_SALSN|nr:hypothetical protein SASPL_143588 [Salvia splendens]